MDDKARHIGEAVSAYEREGRVALESACAAHPDLADEMRRAAAALDILRGAAGERHSAMADATTSIDVGSVVGRFRIEALLGQGGMGRVYRARDLELDREVALKIVTIPFLSHEEALVRIRREARLLAQMRHDNIVRVHEVGQTRDGQPFFVMDLIEGAPLSVLLARFAGRNPVDLDGADLLSSILEDDSAGPGTTSYAEAVVRLLLPIADALEAAHRVGVVHRDVKPSNILVDRHGRPHLMDFGVAREVDAVSLSTTGHGAGTPLYMAPEQISGADRGDATAATDVYSLGVTLYQALTLRVPFEAESPARIFWLILHAEPLPPRKRNPAIALDLETICLAAIEKEPRDRYQSAADLAYDLRYFLDLRPIRRRPLGRVGRLQRFIRRNPWPVTATIAMTLAAVVLSFTAVAARRSVGRDAYQRQRDERAKQLTADAYDTLSKPGTLPDQDFDGERLRAIVSVLADLAPQLGDVHDFNEKLREYDNKRSFSDVSKRGTTALEKAEDLSRKRDPADRAAVDALYADAIEALNRSIALQPGNPSWAAEFASACSFRKEWLSRISSLAPAPESGELDAQGGVGSQVLLDGTPVGADVHLFRYELLSELQTGGEPRLVPVPVRLSPAVGGASDLAACRTEPVQTSLRPGTDVLSVEAVETDSPAARAGIRRGDFVIEVAGQPADGRVLVLQPSVPSAVGASLVKPLSHVIRLDDREVHEEFDVDIVRARTHEGDELSAEAAAPPGESSAIRAVGVRRTGDGFDPPLGSVRESLEGELPPGGVDIIVVSGSDPRPVHLEGTGPSGLTLLPTCYPLAITEGNRIGALPLALRALPPGSYLFVVRKSGCEDMRLPVRLAGAGTTALRSDLLAEGTSPPGFIHVPAGPYMAGADPAAIRPDISAWPSEERWLDGFWISRTETTVAEYLEFINDATTQETIRGGEYTRTWVRIPRVILLDRPIGATCRPLWHRRDGLFVTDWDPRRPITDISCEDADDYCRWRTARSTEGWMFRLPTEDEWEKAARGADGRLHPWGSQRELRFVKCALAHDLQSISRAEVADLLFEPVVRPTRDESPFGMRDAEGNVLEWCVGKPVGGIQFQRPWRGGVASSQGPDDDLLTVRRNGGYPDHPTGNDGFRIVAWKRLDR